MEEERIVSQAEAARLLGLTSQSVRRLVNAGRLPSVMVPGTGGGVQRRADGLVRRVRFSDVEAFLVRYPIVVHRRSYVEPKPPKPKPAPKPPQAIPPGFISQSNAAKRLGVSQTLVSRWVARGTLPTEEVPNKSGGNGTSRRIRLETFEAIVKVGIPPRKTGRPKGSTSSRRRADD